MKIRKATRYIADCGKGFWNKNGCLIHEENCKCWTNPAFRSCKTCKFRGEERIEDKYGSRSWMTCENPNYDHDEHFNQAHEKAPDLCINCSKWEWINGEWDGDLKVWKLR